VCGTCFNLTDGYWRCYACTHNESSLDAVAPISYSPGHEQLHHVLASYKRLSEDVARRFAADLAAILWRFLAGHEACVAKAAGVPAFTIVTTVPSGDRERDESHPLRRIVGELAGPTRDRHERLLRRSEQRLATRAFSVGRYEALRSLRGEPILLIDDTWTTGANAQSAAAALKAAGCGPVGAVVIGRHVNREWHDNDRRLRAISGRFRWDECALCAVRAPPSADSTRQPSTAALHTSTD
jgi:predicted amidophosphoribosyltransferase